MNTTLTIGRIAAASPRFKARLAGALYLLGVLTAAFTEIFVHGGLSVVGALIAVFGMIAVTLLFYDTFSALNRRLCWLAAFFNLLGLAFEALRLQPQGVNIAIVFDGFFCILIGCLVFRSSFQPRTLGLLMVVGGLGWLTYLSTPLANYLSPYNLALGLLGQGSVCLWLCDSYRGKSPFVVAVRS
jgi:Domain of unknown function (DUF4386)